MSGPQKTSAVMLIVITILLVLVVSMMATCAFAGIWWIFS